MSDSPETNQPTRGEAWLLAFACLLPTAVTFVYFRLAEDWPAVTQQLIYGGGKLLQFVLPVVWLGWVRREKLGFVRLTTRGLALGVGFGLLIATVMWFGYSLVLSQVDFFQSAKQAVLDKVDGIGIASPVVFIGVGIFYALCHSLLEEYYWRWFVFRSLKRLVRLPWAIAISSLGFMAHHILVLDRYFHDTPLITALFSISVAVGGAVWAWLYHRTGSLFAPWMSHLIVDAAIFVVGYAMIFG